MSFLLKKDEARIVYENVGRIRVASHSRDDDEIETFPIPYDRWQLGTDQLIRWLKGEIRVEVR